VQKFLRVKPPGIRRKSSLRLIAIMVAASIAVPLPALANTLQTKSFGAVVLNNSIAGAVQNTDCTNPARGQGFFADLYQVSGTTAAKIYLREGNPGVGLADPWLQIVAANRTTVIAEDDDGGNDDTNGDGRRYSSYLQVASLEPGQFVVATTIGAGQLGTYTLFSDVPLTQVTECPQVISMTAPGSAAYGSPISISASTNTGQLVTLTSDTPSICTVATSSAPNFTVSSLKTGTCTVRASQDGNGANAPAVPVTRDITIGAKTLTLTGVSGTPKDFDGTTAVILTGTPSISGVINSDDVSLSGTVSGAFVSAAAGSRAITLSGISLTGAQASNYSLPTSINGTINKINQTITWSPTVSSFLPSNTPVFAAASATGDGSITYSITNAGTTGCTVNSGTRTLSFSTPGTCTVRATASGTNYNPATADYSFTVAKVDQNLTWDPSLILRPSQTGTSFSAAVSSGDGTVSYSVQNAGSSGCTVSGRALSFTSEGICVVRATAASATDFNVATIDVTFTISKLNQFLTWSPTTALSASLTTHNVDAATTSGDGSITYSVVSAGNTGCTLSGRDLSFTAAGTCKVRATAGATSDFNTANTELDFVVSPIPQTITWAPRSTVSVSARTLTPSASPVTSGSGAISYQVIDAGTSSCAVNSSSGVLTFSQAGQCRVRATSASTSLEASASAEVTFTITPLVVVPTPTVTPTPNPSPTLTASASPNATEILDKPVSLKTGSMIEIISSSGQPQQVLVGPSGLPSLKPLESMAIVNGSSVPFTLTPDVSRTGLVIEGGNFAVTLAATSAEGSDTNLNSQGELVLTSGMFATFSGTGFAPNTEIVVWMFSTPRQLGTVVTDESGNFVGKLPIPTDMEAGDHTVQLNGLTEDGETRSLAVGVELAQADSGQSDFPIVITVLGVLALAALTWFYFLGIKRRKKST
jgi:hypothetical protein